MERGMEAGDEHLALVGCRMMETPTTFPLHYHHHRHPFSPQSLFPAADLSSVQSEALRRSSTYLRKCPSLSGESVEAL